MSGDRSPKRATGAMVPSMLRQGTDLAQRVEVRSTGHSLPAECGAAKAIRSGSRGPATARATLVALEVLLVVCSTGVVQAQPSSEALPISTPAAPSAAEDGASGEGGSSPAPPMPEPVPVAAIPPASVSQATENGAEPQGPPPSELYLAPNGAAAASPASSSIYEPPAPSLAEPVPPPEPRHHSPNRSLWLGVRSGWFVPFGDLWGSCAAYDISGNCVNVQGVRWRGYAQNGALLELDAGVRLSRSYNVFALWERAWLTTGSKRESHGGGATDFWALGLRASTDADGLGLLTEFAVGWRQAHAETANGETLELADGLFEGRFGIGADIRLSKSFSLSPMLTLGVGEFRSMEFVDSEGGRRKAMPEGSEPLSHGWLTLQLGGHVDLLGAN
jgi:hypothetical protein